MPKPPKHILKYYPFLRLVCFLAPGIIVQWYFQVTAKAAVEFTSCILILLLIFYFLPAPKKFMLGQIRGCLILLLFFCIGIIAAWQQNIHNNPEWYGNNYEQGETVLITIKEPLIEKPNSHKSLAEVNAIFKDNRWVPLTGNILIYFKKDSVKPILQYGSQIIFSKPLQQIQNSGNPAAFDYRRYCLFQNITGQDFLTTGDYSILKSKNESFLQKFLFGVRDEALRILKQNIHSPKELGIAEALLIGYRNDLDKDLIQAYSNTGVVHIIAISGLHIAIIYSALLMFFALFKSSKAKKWIQPVIILIVIWLFTLIAGAAPSVLRAAVMFTFILAGKFLGRNGNIYNTLAASAFVLLLINPFYLWDVGFQLSYAAVFSIVIFFRPVNNLLYFKNRFLRWLWQLSAVSLAAQVFTIPLVVYHFHQLPVLFLISNLFVVPLSGAVLFAELFLFGFSWLPAFASFIGMLTEKLIDWMNDFIQHLDKLPFSVWNGLYISTIQLMLIFIVTGYISSWVFSKNARHLITALSFIVPLFILYDVDLIYRNTQLKLVVYNVSKHSAVDIIAGNNCRFAGDSIVLQDATLRDFNLKSARIKSRVYNENYRLSGIENHILKVNSSTILMLDKIAFIPHPAKKIKLDVLILTNNFNQTAAELNDLFDCNYIIADSSIPKWRSAKWKKEFEQLHLPFYSVAHAGAITVKL